MNDLTHLDRERIADEMRKRYPENLSSISIEGNGFLAGIKYATQYEREQFAQRLISNIPDQQETDIDKMVTTAAKQNSIIYALSHRFSYEEFEAIIKEVNNAFEQRTKRKREKKRDFY